MSRRMKQTILIAVVLTIVLAPVVLANEEVRSVLFPVELRFNGNPVRSGQAPDVLNYENRVYVPLRFLAERTGADVFYEADSRTVSIKHLPPYPVKSKRAEVDRDDSFVLVIRSAEERYFREEPLHIWADLTYLGEEEVELKYSTPMIAFTITDGHGRSVSTARFEAGRSVFRPYDEYRYDLPPQLIRRYNAEVNEQFDGSDIIHDLPIGTYRIAAEATIQLAGSGGQEKTLKTELEMNIY